MAQPITWSTAANMDFYYGDGDTSITTSQVGARGGNTRYGQVLWFSTGPDGGGVGFTFNWRPKQNTGSSTDLSVRCGISLTGRSSSGKWPGCDSNAIEYFGYQSSLSNDITWSNDSYVFLPNQTYYIYVNRSGYGEGWYNYSTGNSADGYHYGSASMTFKKDLRYTLSINEGANSYITVKRTSSPNGKGSTGEIGNNATIYYGDVLQITYSTDPEYNIGVHKVNTTDNFTSDGTYTVTGNVTVTSTAIVKSYTLTVDEGDNSDITVTRTNSPLKKATETNLSSGSDIYYGDVLKIIFTPSTGYNIDVHTVNTLQWTSGAEYTVSGNNAKNVAVVSTAIVQSFILTINEGKGSTIVVDRTESKLQNAAKGIIDVSKDNKIYYGDVLKITTSSDIIHEILERKLTTSSGTVVFTSGDSHDVVSDVIVETITRILGIAHIGDGTKFETYLIYIYDENGWSQYIPYIYDGTSWVVCN